MVACSDATHFQHALMHEQFYWLMAQEPWRKGARFNITGVRPTPIIRTTSHLTALHRSLLRISEVMLSSKLSLRCALVVLLVAAQWSAVATQGKIPPLIAEEFTANMLQNKFNHNGFVVNHTCAGTYYSSYSQQMIRGDCTVVDLISNNHSQPSPLTSSLSLSLLDFTKNPPLNTFFEMGNLVNKSSCSTYPASWLPPPSSTFLRDVNAGYAGTEITADYGVCEKWSFELSEIPGTIFTFYFDSFTNLVRYDFISLSSSEQGNVGVTNKFFNMVTGDKNLLPPTIFAGSGQCPNGTISRSPFSWR